MTDKNQLRREIRKELKEISGERRKVEEEKTSLMVQRLSEWGKADLILGYLSFGEEFSVDFLLKLGLSMGKKIAVPKVLGNNIDFFCIDNLNPSQFELIRGIREPKRSPEEKIDIRRAVDFKEFNSPLMLVPGLAFSPKGERLGRGRGFYDRYLGLNSDFRFRLFTVGICFSDQIKSFVPINKDDKLVDKVVFSSYLKQ